MIKGIIYDMGDIFFEGHWWRKWMWQTFTAMGLFKGTFAEFYDLWEKHLLEVYNGSGKKYDQAYADLLAELGVPEPEEFTRGSYAVKRHFEVTRSLYPGVRETLAEIKAQGVKNIVITDNESAEAAVREKIVGRYGINDLLHHVITSNEIKATKPDPIAYSRSLEVEGLKPEEALFVGHDVDEIQGAKTAGIKTVEYNNYLGRETGADIKIANFSDLLGIVFENAPGA